MEYARKDAADKPKKGKKSEGPSTLEMVVEAIKHHEDRKGTSVASIKMYILNTYPMVDPAALKPRLKKAFAKGVEEGLLCRPKGMEETGASLSGRYRIVRAKLAKLEKPKKAKKQTDAAARKPAKKSAIQEATRALKAKKPPAKKAAAEKVKATVSTRKKKAKTPAKKPAEKKPSMPKKTAGEASGKSSRGKSTKSARGKKTSGKEK